MRRHAIRLLSIALAALLVVPLLAIQRPAAAAPGDVTRVSVTNDGREVYGHSMGAVISPDGRYVAFESWAVDLVSGDTNGVSDVFVHDRFTRVTERVSTASDGGDPGGPSSGPAINADGRFVMFASAAANIVPNDANGQLDVFIHDRQMGVNKRVSVSSTGAEGNGGSYATTISADGSLVAFSSEASNLVEGDTNSAADVFVHDLRTGVTERVSVSNEGQEADGYSEDPSISADGRYVVFSSGSGNLVPDELVGPQIYLRDRELGMTTLVSVSNVLEPIDSRAPIISSDGNVIAFNRFGEFDRPMVRDLRANLTEYVDLATDGSMADASGSVASISADGRYVLFLSDATNLSEIDIDHVRDLFVRDRWLGTTTLVSTLPSGDPSGNWTFDGAINADGSVVAFSSMAENLVPADYNAHTDVFVREMGWQERIPTGDPAFQQTWERTDQAVAEGRVARTWMWGPSPFTGVVLEPYAESPGGTRTVQYFDKARMERTYSDLAPGDPWATTNGLLVVELVSGRMQIGENQFITRGPAWVNIAGDPDDLDGPTYATFGTLLDDPPLTEGGVITQRLDRAGTLTSNPALAALGVRAGTLVPETGHRVASVFWDFLHSRGTVIVDDQYRDAQLFEPWYYASGLPISEAYWTTVLVGGTPRDVLVQAFERRVLTYTPDNPSGWQVEAGNVGQHYFRWRYGGPVPQPTGTIAFSRTTYDPATGAEVQRSGVTIWADGSHEQVLTPANLIGTPRMAPEGDRVAWSERVGDRIHVFVANPDGSNRHNLTAGLPFGGTNPDWSPDGSRIAFDVNGQVWIIGADGSSPYAVANGWGPRWSPDGSRLAISVQTDVIGRYHGVATVRVDGSDFAGIAACVSEFAWTPDSREIVAFPGQYTGCGWASIFIAGADGSNLRPLELNLPDEAIVTNNIAFSPDGTRVAFTVYTGASQDIFVANSDFTDAQPLTRSDASDAQPAWSPDGTWIAFTRFVTGGGDIFAVEVDDPENLWRITDDDGTSDEAPSW